MSRLLEACKNSDKAEQHQTGMACRNFRHKIPDPSQHDFKKHIPKGGRRCTHCNVSVYNTSKLNKLGVFAVPCLQTFVLGFQSCCLCSSFCTRHKPWKIRINRQLFRDLASVRCCNRLRCRTFHTSNNCFQTKNVCE